MLGGVEAGPGEVAQSFCQLRQERVSDGAGDFCGEHLPPSPSPICVAIRESHVELLLSDSGGAAELGWPGRSQVAGVDLCGGTPFL
jgi:hypothetical protein